MASENGSCLRTGSDPPAGSSSTPSSRLSIETVSVLASAIENRTVRDGALSTCVGEIRDRDALALLVADEVD